MSWTIEIEYETGDSFSHRGASGSVEITWTKLDVAKAALKRIADLDEYDQAKWLQERLSYKPVPEKPEGYCVENPDLCIMLPLDDGSEQRLGTFWRGYFESLRKAHIVAQTEDGMSYTR